MGKTNIPGHPDVPDEAEVASLASPSNSGFLPVSGEAADHRSNFPEKLYFMLEDVANDGLDHIVSWQPHGRCFLVHEQERFVKDMLPM